MQRSPEWHSQQGGLITHFNQLYRWGLLFIPDLFQLPLRSSRDGFTGWAEPSSPHTREGSQTFHLLSSQRCVEIRASSPLKRRNSSLGCCQSTTGRPFGATHPLLRGKCPWCNGSSSHWFDKVSRWLQPQIDYLTGLPDMACGPRHPMGWFRLHLLTQFEIQLSGRTETPNCCKATRSTNNYEEA